jgi:hypothetical protein
MITGASPSDLPIIRWLFADAPTCFLILSMILGFWQIGGKH